MWDFLTILVIYSFLKNSNYNIYKKDQLIYFNNIKLIRNVRGYINYYQIFIILNHYCHIYFDHINYFIDSI